MVGGSCAQDVGQRVVCEKFREQYARAVAVARKIGMLAEVEEILVRVGVEGAEQLLLHQQ